LLCGSIILSTFLLLAPPAAEAQFVDVADSVLADTGTGFGVAWGDYDKDGDHDLFLTNGSGSNKLFRNHGVLGFADSTTSLVACPEGGDMGVVWIDYDDDSHLDLYRTNAVRANCLLRNLGGVFTPVAAGDAADPGQAQSSAWADYDLDGDLDAFVTFWNQPNKLFRNDGGGVFVDATPPVLADTGKGTGAAWADFDRDGDSDLYAGIRLGGRLYRNEGGGSFTDVTTPALDKVGVTGVTWGDYDNDGDLDLYLCRDLVSNYLLRNDSTPDTVVFTFIYATALNNGGNGQGCSFLDYDNDMDMDLFVANAGVDNSTGDSNALIRNDRFDFFTDVSAGPVAAVTNSRGIALADYDGDGFVDVYVANWLEPNQLLQNTMASNGNHWLQVDLIGNGDSNFYGVGARVRVMAGGRQQVQEISAGSGLYSMNALTASFGLGTNTTADVRVWWPSGVVSDSTGITADQRITIYETGTPIGVGAPDPGLPPVARLYANSPNPFRSVTAIRYDLVEPARVDLRILDPAGRLVKTLERSLHKPAGGYEVRWDGRDDGGRILAKGVYFYSLQARGLRQTRRLVLLR
jgi:hypothetical protein